MTRAIIDPDPVNCARCRHRSVTVDLSPATSAIIADSRRGRFVVARGERLSSDPEGTVAITVYSGLAARWRRQDNRAVLLSLVYPGDHVDLTLDTSIWVEALTDLTCCGFDMAGRRTLLSDPDLSERMLSAEARWRRLAEERLAVMATRPAIGRVCHFLLSVHEALRCRGVADISDFTLPISRSTLAAATGLSAMHLRRSLNELSRLGVLTMGQGRRVTFLDRAHAITLAGVSFASVQPAPLI